MYPMYEGDGYKTGDRPGKKSDVINFQLKLRDLGETLDVDGAYGPATTAAIKRLLPTIGDKPIQDGAMYTGRNGYSVDKAFAALQGGDGDGYDHTALEAKVAENAVKLTAHKSSTDHDNRYVREVTVKGPTT